ncbi:3-keto-5-aminohexanoate cleavage protein [Nocardia sp. NPDC049707]|uniref:3-keto-5-aminohexanoate cleavage protein n=1 Tax=Nocardia sp. NPDC049707 TaxID=3154735 RepID=UPI003427F0D6
MEKLIIGVHPNEGTMRDRNPDVPFTPEELASVIKECADVGATVTHFHARTADGAMTHESADYQACFDAIRAEADMLLAPSLANVPGYTIDQRVANVLGVPGLPRSRPEFMVIEMGCASMDLWDPVARKFGSDNRLFLNHTGVQEALLGKANELAMHPWLVSFNNSWSRAIQCQLDAGHVGQPFVVQFVLGGPEFPAAHAADLNGLESHLAAMPVGHRYHWFVSAYRGDLLNVAADVIRRGGHLSIGVGDHHYEDRGAPTNAELVASLADLAQSLGRPVASAAETREILGVTR